MLQRWITTITEDMARQLGYDQDQQEILQYAFIITMNTLIGFVVIALVGGIFGVAKLALVAALTGGVLRTYSGGAHATSPARCSAIGAIAYVSLGIIAQLLTVKHTLLVLFIITTLFAGWSIWSYAPAEAPGKPLGSRLHRQKLRQRAFITWGVWVIGFGLIFAQWGSSPWLIASCLGALWQSVTITPVGHKITAQLDSFLKRFIKDR